MLEEMKNIAIFLQNEVNFQPRTFIEFANRNIDLKFIKFIMANEWTVKKLQELKLARVISPRMATLSSHFNALSTKLLTEPTSSAVYVGGPILFTDYGKSIVMILSSLGLVENIKYNKSIINAPIEIKDQEGEVVWVEQTNVFVDGMLVDFIIAASYTQLDAYFKKNYGCNAMKIFMTKTNNLLPDSDPFQFMVHDSFNTKGTWTEADLKAGDLPGLVSILAEDDAEWKCGDNFKDTIYERILKVYIENICLKRKGLQYEPVEFLYRLKNNYGKIHPNYSLLIDMLEPGEDPIFHAVSELLKRHYKINIYI